MMKHLPTRMLVTIIALLNAAALLWWTSNLFIAVPLVIVVSGLLDWLSRPSTLNEVQEQNVEDGFNQEVTSIQGDVKRLPELGQLESPAIPPLNDWLAKYATPYTTSEQNVNSRKPIASEFTIPDTFWN